VWERRYDELPVRTYRTAEEVGKAAAADFAAIVAEALTDRPEVAAVLATGNSQLPFFAALHERDDIQWSRLHVLHMDEYLGMGPEHPASFRRYLNEKLADKVTLAGFHGLAGEADDVEAEMSRYADLIRQLDPVVCVLGIGENGHLAFNDPPANFTTDKLLEIVELDEACRRQQWGEGHFPTLDSVPRTAITLTVPALLRPAHVLAIVPEARKAAAVQTALTGPVSPDCPASALRPAGNVRLYLDGESASLLPPQVHATA
jgi:glucosamine-6-phosphate deaminase